MLDEQEVRDNEEQTEEYRERRFSDTATEAPRSTVSVETGRGNAATVPVGSPFAETIRRLAEEANYGGYFRVFLNGEEILEETEAPGIFEAGMRVAICSYDKVGS